MTRATAAPLGCLKQALLVLKTKCLAPTARNRSCVTVARLPWWRAGKKYSSSPGLVAQVHHHAESASCASLDRRRRFGEQLQHHPLLLGPAGRHTSSAWRHRAIRLWPGCETRSHVNSFNGWTAHAHPVGPSGAYGAAVAGMGAAAARPASSILVSDGNSTGAGPPRSRRVDTVTAMKRYRRHADRLARRLNACRAPIRFRQREAPRRAGLAIRGAVPRLTGTPSESLVAPSAAARQVHPWARSSRDRTTWRSTT